MGAGTVLALGPEPAGGSFSEHAQSTSGRLRGKDAQGLTPPSLPGEFSTPEQGDYDVIELPYQGETLSMLIASPFQRDAPLSALVAAIDSCLIAEWKSNMSAVTRLLVLPK